MLRWLVVCALLATQALAQEVYFSPRGGCTDACVRLINSARSSVLVLAYSFTSTPIGEALVRAKRRGVKVQCVVDRSQRKAKRSLIPILRRAGVTVLIDSKHHIMHQKVLVVDDSTVENGSFNFSNEAESGNSENVLIARNAALAAKYRDNWLIHQGHSVPVP
jgi:phosphatidylserine/phosphatidylglycerophosphate/cardiolipin synthase-like enzyme